MVAKIRISRAAHEKTYITACFAETRTFSPHTAEIIRFTTLKTYPVETFISRIAPDIFPVFRLQTHKYPSKCRLAENISEITKNSRQMQQKE